MARIYLIDTLYHIFRAFHALPPMTAPDGTPTNALYGVLGIFGTLWKQEKVEHAVAVFESMTGTFREEIDPEYKANRPPPDPALTAQIPLVEKACQVLGIPTLSVAGYEADDVLASLARRAAEHGHSATLVSNDKDLAQVLQHGDIELLRLSGSGKKAKMERVRPEQVEGFFGVEPRLIPSFLALCGDSVDNIKGLSGVGPKTAVKLLKEGDLNDLLENPQRAGKLAGALVENKERLKRDLHLATVCDQVDLGFEGFPLERLRPGPIQEAAPFYRRLGMNRIPNQLESLLEPEPTVADLWAL